MRGLSGDEILRLPVRQRGILLGRPVDLLLDLEHARVVGVDVLCGDDVHRFLPLGAASAAPDAIAVGSALTLLDPRHLDFYRRRGRTLSSLRGTPVEVDRVPVGALKDVVLGKDAEIAALVVDGPGGTRHVAFDGRARIVEPEPRALAG